MQFIVFEDVSHFWAAIIVAIIQYLYRPEITAQTLNLRQLQCTFLHFPCPVPENEPERSIFSQARC